MLIKSPICHHFFTFLIASVVTKTFHGYASVLQEDTNTRVYIAKNTPSSRYTEDEEIVREEDHNEFTKSKKSKIDLLSSLEASLEDGATVNRLSYKDYTGEDDYKEDNGGLAVPRYSDSTSNQESGNHEDEETYASAVLSINELSKDAKQQLEVGSSKKHKNHTDGEKSQKTDLKSQKTTNNRKNKTKKRKEKTFTEDSTTSSGIDLEYLQKLFENKNLHQFQKNQTEHLNRKALKIFRDSLYSSNGSQQLKILENFDQPKQSTQQNLKKAIEAVLKEEASSIRYKIKFPTFYHSVGTITMPYDDLVEPFEAWYAGELNMSRIDYYQGKCDQMIYLGGY